MSIQEELSQLRKELAPSGARLALVSKFQSNGKIMEAYEAGQRIFAESRPQEMELKALSLPKPSPVQQDKDGGSSRQPDTFRRFRETSL